MYELISTWNVQSVLKNKKNSFEFYIYASDLAIKKKKKLSQLRNTKFCSENNNPES